VLVGNPVGICDGVRGLTARQRETMEPVVAGYPGKSIAAELGISQRTGESHRSLTTKKTGATSIPASVRLIFVAAAGNGGPNAASAYPAAYERVIAVTAIDSDDQLYGKANRGAYVALAAPGVDILALAPRGAYEMSSGTSLAAAHVSGIVALMLERRPGLTTDQARAILLRTARDPGHDASRRGLGAGIIDAARAVADAD
jgi:subtilisin family serine protease